MNDFSVSTSLAPSSSSLFECIVKRAQELLDIKMINQKSQVTNAIRSMFDSLFYTSDAKQFQSGKDMEFNFLPEGLRINMLQ